MHLIHRLQSVFKGHAPVRRMQVENIDCVCPELFQARGGVLFQAVRGVDASFVRVAGKNERTSWKVPNWVFPRPKDLHFSCKRQTAIFPGSVACPSFLFAADVHTRRVDLVVALGLEIIEAFSVVVDVSDTRSSSSIGA